MEEIVLEGRLSCGGHQWPVQVHFPPPHYQMRLRFDGTFPSPSELNDIRYQGNATVFRADPQEALPNESDLQSRDVLLLLDRLPCHGPCPTGQWQLPIHLTPIEQPTGGEYMRFEFVQNGTIGRPSSYGADGDQPR
jgi:hypothetical protein